MTILIISAQADVHAQAVQKVLAARGAAFTLLDLSDFPTHQRLALRLGGARPTYRLARPEGLLDLGAMRSVWWRRPQPFRLPDTLTDPVARQFATAEALTVFNGLYQSLDARWINPPAADAAAGHKVYQLHLAREIGLEIPETLVTNDPAEAREFWREYPGEVIHKQFVALPETWRETRRVRPEDERHLDGVAHAPVLFQRHVEAVSDLRVIAVDGRLFAAAVPLAGLDYPQDVRMNPRARYAAHDLPPALADRLRLLVARLGLVYGAIDLRLTPDDRYVFLECNPAGQFLYIEQDSGQEISAAVADALMRPAGSGEAVRAEGER